MKYMLMMHAPKEGWTTAGIGTWAPKDIHAHIAFMQGLNEKLKAAGEFVDGQGLAGPEEAKSIRARKDGTPVGTPVNIVFRGDHAYFRTYDKAYKTKRMARNPQVEVAPSTYSGKATGPAVQGRVRLLSEEEAKPVRRLLARKHRFQQGFAVPLFHRVKRYKTLHYELTLDG